MGDVDQEKAATKLQAVQKGKSARKIRQQQADAATKMQAVQRGNLARRKSELHKSGKFDPLSVSDKERRAAAQARAQAASAGPRTLAQLGLKSGLPVNPVPGLRFLTFYSWWHEAGTKRYMEICFDLQTELFQLVLDKNVCHMDVTKKYNPLTESQASVTAQDTKVMSMHLHEKLSGSCAGLAAVVLQQRLGGPVAAAAIQGPRWEARRRWACAHRKPPSSAAFGPPGNQHAESLRRPHLQGWDLHVGCRLNILGRPTSLMQCNLLTGKWLEYHADRLGRIKNVLAEALRKYETVPVLAAIESKKGGHRAQGSQDLRLLLNQIDALQLRLGHYRPNQAVELARLAQQA